MRSYSRKFTIAKTSFMVILTGSLIALALQSYIHADTYAALNFVEAGIERVAVTFGANQVETSITVSVYNPSSLNSMLLKSVRVTTFLNGERLRYTSGQFFYSIEIPPGATTSVILKFRVTVDAEVTYYVLSRETLRWQWSFDASVIVALAFKEARIDASGSYEGADITP